MWSQPFTAAALALCLLPSALGSTRAGLRAHKPAAKRQARELALLEKRADPTNGTDSSDPTGSMPGGNSSTSMRYMSNMTSPFFVESMPDVNFDLGELYSGSIPINTKNQSEALFFFFQPTIGEQVDEITIWLNGGPGCSSLEGFFQENGRWTWQPGTYLPVENAYSWVNLTNMLWVEYPIGVGFSSGTPKATTEEEIAQDFLGFFENFQKTFGIKNYKIYVTGESYAGRYVPYISAAMLDRNNTEYYDLTGALVYDPCIGEFDYVQEEIPTYPFVEANNNLFNFNESFLATLESLHKSCGYADFIDRYYKFPPTENQPTLFFNYSDPVNATCDLLDTAIAEALRINPCFNLYEINQMCPIAWDVLGFPTSAAYLPEGTQLYFNRTDVKKAIHAPENVDWAECTSIDVFVLPQVIEATNRVLVSNGDYDMVIITNGTLLAIQNMTWAGKLGFQNKPNQTVINNLTEIQYADVLSDAGYGDYLGPQGVMGIQHYERGLLWTETFQSGHMQPQFQPKVAYKHLQWLLRRIENL